MDTASLQKQREFLKHENFGSPKDFFLYSANNRRPFYRATETKKKKNYRKCLLKLLRPKKWRSYEDVIESFGHNTNLLGIQHIIQRQNLFWIIAYLLCLIMSIFQTWNVTFDFIEGRTKQSFSVENAKFLPVPSVTVCNCVVLPVNFNMSLIPGYTTMEEHSSCSNETARDEREKIFLENERAIVKFRRGLNESERMRLSGSVESFISKCRFKKEECVDFKNKRKYFVFNNPFYGTCATFNPAFDKSSAMKEKVTTKLRMQIIFRDHQLRLASAHPTIVVRIHSPGTAPVLDQALITDVKPGTKGTFNIKLDKKTFLPRKSDPLGCIDYTDLRYRKKSTYYSEQSPYLYSVKNCMKSCEERYLKLRCNMTEASSPVSYDEEERIQEAKAYGILLHADACTIPEPLDMKFCDCPLACLYTRFLVNHDNSVTKSACKEESEDSLLKAHVVVRYESNIYDKVEEEFIVNLTNYLGVLGGNVSLWIGICIISALELIELVFNLLLVWYRKRKRKRNSDRTNVTNISIPTAAVLEARRKPRTSRQMLFP